MSRPARTDHDIEQLLSRPTPGAIAAVQALDGDYMVLGVGGKMGTTTAVMLRRALDAAGKPGKVYGVLRFSRPEAKREMEQSGIVPIACDPGGEAAGSRQRGIPGGPEVRHGFRAGQDLDPEHRGPLAGGAAVPRRAHRGVFHRLRLSVHPGGRARRRGDDAGRVRGRIRQHVRGPRAGVHALHAEVRHAATD